MDPSLPPDTFLNWFQIIKARARHLEARQLLDDGIDPSAKKQLAEKTFEAVAREWHSHWMANRNHRHAHYVLKRLEADIFPEIGSLPLSEIPTSAFRNAVQKVERRGALDIAKRVLQNCDPADRRHRGQLRKVDASGAGIRKGALLTELR